MIDKYRCARVCGLLWMRKSLLERVYRTAAVLSIISDFTFLQLPLFFLLETLTHYLLFGTISLLFILLVDDIKAFNLVSLLPFE